MRQSTPSSRIGRPVEMIHFMVRWYAAMPYQEWRPFPDEAIVLVKNSSGERRIDLAKNLWWGYETEMGEVGDGVIMEAARLDRRRER